LSFYTFSRIGISGDLVMLGGVARNPAIVSFIKSRLRLGDILVPDEPEYGPAIGAALLAFDSESEVAS
jgi:activator of 2-hydroxyglutaryl-CoA dehydratase